MSDYSKLQALAESATPGPWAVDDDTYVMCGRGPIFDTEYSGPEDSTRVETYEAADAAFIAAASPTAILAMLAEIERLRNALGPLLAHWDDLKPGESINVDAARAAMSKARQ